jgi:hypothetical protein
MEGRDVMEVEDGVKLLRAMELVDDEEIVRCCQDEQMVLSGEVIAEIG